MRSIDEITDLPEVGPQSREGHIPFSISNEALEESILAGDELHDSVVRLAMRGYSRERLESLLDESTAKTERPDRWRDVMESDLPRAIKSAAAKKQRDLERMLANMPIPPKTEGAALATPPEAPLFARVSDMTAVHRSAEWLIGGHIEHPTLSVLFGDPEAGKSFAAIDWACCVATGRRWNGKKVLHGPVLYLAGEGFNGLSNRFLAWRLHNGVSQQAWDAADLFVLRRAVDLLDHRAGTELWAAVEALGVKPVLIVVDTLSRMTPGMNESAADEMSKFVQWCDKTKSAFNCTILVVHHSGVSDKSRVRGSSVLKGATDVEIGAAKEKDGRLKLFNTKMKEGRRFADRLFQFGDVTLPWVRQPEEEGDAPRNETSAVLVASDEPAEPKKEKRNGPIDLLLDVIRTSGGKIDNHEALEAFVSQRGGDRETARKRFYDARKKGIDAGTILFAPEDNLLRMPLLALS